MAPVPRRIFPRRHPRLFLREWRDHFGLTQTQVGNRIGPSGVTAATVARWEAWAAEGGGEERQPGINALAAYAEALGIPPADLYRHPDRPSADDLLRGQPAEVVDYAIRMIKGIRR